MKACDIQDFDIDTSGKLEWAIPLRLPDGKLLYEMRIANWKEEGTEYTIAGNVRYFGSLDKDSINPQTGPQPKIRFLQTMLPSGNIHQIVFTKNYVASGDPVSTEDMEKAYSYGYGEKLLKRMENIHKSQ